MEAVKAFNAELSSLFEARPPISKAKMTAITRSAIKAIKFYKHVVQSVEKFIQKCKPEYKVPGLYVVDSIVRQSRHQFSAEKDVFAPRFARNIQTTFMHLFNCPPDDKGKVVRVLNLWQKNQVFSPEVIQPLLDMASRVGTDQQLQPANGVQLKTPPVSQSQSRSQGSKPSPAKDPAWLTGNLDTSSASSQLAVTPVPQVKPLTNTGAIDPNIMLQLQTLQNLLLEKQSEAAQYKKEEVKFDKKLLDFDYDEDDEEPSIPQLSQPQQPLPSIDSLQTILSNPEVLRHLQTLQQQMSNRKQEPTQDEIEEKMRRLQEMRHQEEEFDKHLAQTLPNLPFAAECDFKPVLDGTSDGLGLTQGPAPVAPPQHPVGSLAAFTASGTHPFHSSSLQDQDLPSLDFDERNRNSNISRVDVEVIDLLKNDSPPRRSPPSRSSRDSRRRRRSRSRGRHSRSRSRSRRRARSTSEDRETDRRRKRGLPPVKKNHLAVCSTTLWIGHLSKLVTEEELSNTFGHYGDIVSINLIPPRGCAFVCMNRRQDADKALKNLKHVKLHSKAITIAWAPGKGMKEKEWKDYWEVETGTSYIPWNKLSKDTDFTLLEEGGMLDEETFPDWLKSDPSLRRRGERKEHDDQTSAGQKSKDEHSKQGAELDIPMPTGNIPGFIPLPETTMAPPPVSQTATPMPPPPLGLIPPPFALPPQRLPGLLGPMGPPMMGPMGNVPLGVPPPLMMPPPPQGMVPRMPGPPFNHGPPVGMMPMPPGGDKSKPPQMPGMPPDGFQEHLASMFGLPNLPLGGLNIQQQQSMSNQQSVKGATEMEVDEPDEKDQMQNPNLEMISTLGPNMVGNFSQPPPNFNLPPSSQAQNTPSNQNNRSSSRDRNDRSEEKSEGRGDRRSNSRSDGRSEERRGGKDDTPRRRDRDGKDSRGREDRDRDKRRRRDSSGDRSRDRDRRRGDRRRDWGKGGRSSKWGDRADDDDRKDRKGSKDNSSKDNNNSSRAQDKEDGDRKQPLLPLPPSQHDQGPPGPAMQFPPQGIRPPGPGGFGPPRFGPPPNGDDGMQGPPMGMGDFMPRDFQPPPRGDFQPPIRGDFPPPRGDFQGPPMHGDFPPQRGDFPPPRGDFQGPPRDFQPRGDFPMRGFFRGPMRPMRPGGQGGPRHRQPNGPMFGPQRGPPGPPMGMRGPRGMPPGRMDGPPHGFMGRGFPPGMRGPPPMRFGGPGGNMGPPPGGPQGARRWGEDERERDRERERPPRKSRWSSAAPSDAIQQVEASESIAEDQPPPIEAIEDKQQEQDLPPGAEEPPPEFVGEDFSCNEVPPEDFHTEFAPPEEHCSEFVEPGFPGNDDNECAPGVDSTEIAPVDEPAPASENVEPAQEEE